MSKLGRPSIYSQELVDELCERMVEGESLRSVCRDDAMPSTSTVMRWLQSNEKFRAQYAWACRARAEADASDIVSIADTATTNDVQVQRLRVDARKWTASKLVPKVYGDHHDLNVNVDPMDIARKIREAVKEADETTVCDDVA